MDEDVVDIERLREARELAPVWSSEHACMAKTVDAVLAGPVGVVGGVLVSSVEGWSVTVQGVGPLPDGWAPGWVVLVPVEGDSDD